MLMAVQGSLSSLRLNTLVVVVVIVQLFVVELNSLLYPSKREGEERDDVSRQEADDGQSEAAIRQLQELQMRRRESQLEKMIRALVERRLTASAAINNNKKNYVYRSYEDAVDRVDYTSSGKNLQRKSYEEDAPLPPFPLD